MELYIVRHGNTPSGAQTEPPLTQTGEKQAQALAERLLAVHFDHIFTSPLQRCVQTIAPLTAKNGCCVQLLYALLEKGTKANYVGLPFSVLKEICPQLQENTFLPFADGLPQEESDAQALCRAQTVIAYIRATCAQDSTVLLVAHGTFNNFLIHAALNFPLQENFNFSQDNTGLTHISFLHEDNCIRTKLRFMNDTTHFSILR